MAKVTVSSMRPQKRVEAPGFDVETDGTRADEGVDLHRHPGPLGDVGYRLHVAHHCAGGAHGLELHAAVADLLDQGLDILPRPPACPGKPDIRHPDAEVLHEVDELDLLLDGGVGDRRGLKPVPESFVHQVEAAGCEGSPLVQLVPVEDDVLRRVDRTCSHKTSRRAPRPGFSQLTRFRGFELVSTSVTPTGKQRLRPDMSSMGVAPGLD